MPANWIVLSAQGDRCPLTTGLRNARHDMPFQHASRRADAGLRKGFRIAQLRGGSQSILTWATALICAHFRPKAVGCFG